MRMAPITVIAPGLLDQSWSEAQVLGSAAWLWMHSASHRDLPMHTLPVLLLPAIKNRQFLIGFEDGRPAFYLSWANLSVDAERRYLASNPLLMPQTDWNSGDRMWVLDWIAPFGHTAQARRAVMKQLLANRLWRSLYHRGNERGMRVKTFRGAAVMPEEAQEWFNTHPVAYPDSFRKHNESSA